MPLQVVDYGYNVRGWLTGINDNNTADNDLSLSGNDLFGFKINYNDPKNFGSGENPAALFNGNIAQTLWKTGSANPNPPNNSVSERYSYTYDALNRITSAIDNTGNYNLYDLTYDENGNILTLKRKGNTNVGATTFGTMDNLVYTYKSVGNQLKRVKDYTTVDQGFNDGIDTAEEYTYDANGNMVQDLNKGIQAGGITYNHLNLPIEVKFDNNNLKKITYIYDAVGTKLKKTVNDNGSLTDTEYVGNYIYENGKLQFFKHAEGYVSPKNVDNYSQGFDYVYNYKDHLGNTRLSYTDADGNGSIDPANEIVKESNYYPFGLSHKGYNNNVSPLGNSVAKRFMFGGKELDESLGLATYDFGARNYDHTLGRWMNLDPLAEQMRRHSPYNYAFNNPLRFTDPDGMAPDDIILRGANNSSITIVTDLIDVDIDASGIVGDLGGNFTFEGEDILVAGLDIVGIADPTGVADIAAASIEAKNGNYGSAILSGLGVVPYLGDVGKLGKIPKHLKTINKAIDGVKAQKRAAKLSKANRSGKDFTKAGKEAVIDLNKAKNNGKVICETCGTNTLPATQSKKGVTPSKKERQVDHKKAKSKGGSGTPNNGQVLCRDCNIKKSNN